MGQRTITLDDTSFTMDYSIDKTFDSDRFLKLRLKVCHDNLSPNRTFFTKETMATANSTIQYIPILVNVLTDENGVPCFGGHDSHVEQDKFDENEARLIYDEQPIGFIPDNAVNNCVIEEVDGLSYTFVDAYVWRNYANYAEDLIEQAVDTKLSMEITIPDGAMSYNAKDRYWLISDYIYSGITLLNPKYGTGMKGAKATTATFASTSPSVQEQLIVMMDELTKVLTSYNKLAEEKLQKGGDVGLTKFEELLIKYDKSIEQIDFEYEGLSDEDLEQAFRVAFAGNEASADDGAESGESADTSFTSGEHTDVPDGSGSDASAGEVDTKYTVTFTLSHEDIRYALYELLYARCKDKDDDDEYVIVQVFDDKMTYQSWYTCKYFEQKYTKNNESNTVELVGDCWEVFAEFVTQEERDALKNLRQDYLNVQSQLQLYQQAELLKQKEEALSVAAYDSIRTIQEFVELPHQAELSVVECVEKADAMLGKYQRMNGLNFVATPTTRCGVKIQSGSGSETKGKSFIESLLENVKQVQGK